MSTTATYGTISTGIMLRKLQCNKQLYKQCDEMNAEAILCRILTQPPWWNDKETQNVSETVTNYIVDTKHQKDVPNASKFETGNTKLETCAIKNVKLRKAVWQTIKSCISNHWNWPDMVSKWLYYGLKAVCTARQAWI